MPALGRLGSLKYTAAGPKPSLRERNEVVKGIACVPFPLPLPVLSCAFFVRHGVFFPAPPRVCFFRHLARRSSSPPASLSSVHIFALSSNATLTTGAVAGRTRPKNRREGRCGKKSAGQRDLARGDSASARSAPSHAPFPRPFPRGRLSASARRRVVGLRLGGSCCFRSVAGRRGGELVLLAPPCRVPFPRRTVDRYSSCASP